MKTPSSLELLWNLIQLVLAGLWEWIAVVSLVFLFISLAVAYTGVLAQLQTVLLIIGLLAIVGVALTRYYLRRKEYEVSLSFLQGSLSIQPKPSESLTRGEISTAYSDYVQAREQEIRQKEVSRTTCLPCTPAVQQLVEKAVALADVGKATEALVLLEAQKLIEGKVQKRERTSASLKGFFKQYGSVTALLTFVTGTLLNFFGVLPHA